MERLKPRIVTLGYHDVTDDPGSSGFQTPTSIAYKHTCSYFRENVTTIGEAGIKPSLISELNFEESNRSLIVTFDDGGQSAMYIADELETLGWRGHFFVITSRIGLSGWLTKENIRDLSSRGHIIGSHSHTHPHVLFLLSVERVIDEYQRSIDILSDIAGNPIVSASLCGGETNYSTYRALAATSIRYCFTSEPTVVPRRLGETNFLGRFCAKRFTSLKTIENICHFRGFLSHRIVRFCKQCLRRAIYKGNFLKGREELGSFLGIRNPTRTDFGVSDKRSIE